MHLFSQSPKVQCGLLFQPLCRWVHVTFFVLVLVEVRVGHVCCECVIRLLETQVVDDASRARSRARRTHKIHGFVTLELSRNKSCSGSDFPVVQIPACCRWLLAERRVKTHYLAHSKFCESVEPPQFGLRRLLSFRIVNKSVQQFSSVFTAVDVLCRVLIATFRVARLTVQTRKLWSVGVATDRNAGVTLACVSFHFIFPFFASTKKIKKNGKIRK